LWAAICIGLAGCDETIITNTIKPAIQTRQASENTVPTEAYALYCKGNSERLKGNLEKAVRYFEKALALDGDSELLHQRLAECYILMGPAFQKKAFEHVAALAQLRPDNFGYQFTVATYYEQEKETDKAIAAYKKCLGLAKDNPAQLYKCRSRLAQLYCGRGRYDEAIEVLKELLKAKPRGQEGYTVHYLLGLCYEAKQQYEEAVSCYESCLKLDPQGKQQTTAGVQWQLGVALERLNPKGPGSGIPRLETLLKLYPGARTLRFWLARFYEKAEQNAKAKGIYEALLKGTRAPVNEKLGLFVCRALARRYELDGQVKEAMALLQRLPLKPDAREKQDPVIRSLRRLLRVQLVFLYDNHGMDAKVVPTLRAILADDPDHAAASNYLAYWFAEKGTNLDEAVELVKRALKREPRNGSYLDTLAWAHFKKASQEDSEVTIELALQELLQARKFYREERKREGLNPLDDPVILDHIGDAHFALGAWEQARESWKASLDTAVQLKHERPDALPNPDYVRLKLSRVERLLEGERPAARPKPPSSR